jgi:hypothetical protein
MKDTQKIDIIKSTTFAINLALKSLTGLVAAYLILESISIMTNPDLRSLASDSLSVAGEGFYLIRLSFSTYSLKFINDFTFAIGSISRTLIAGFTIEYLAAIFLLIPLLLILKKTAKTN